jgi:hypothetical protein
MAGIILQCTVVKNGRYHAVDKVKIEGIMPQRSENGRHHTVVKVKTAGIILWCRGRQKV